MYNRPLKFNSYTYNVFLFLLFFSTFFLLKFKSIEFLSPLRFSLFLTTFLFLPKIVNYFKWNVKEHLFFYASLLCVLLYTVVQTILLDTDFGMLSRTIVFLIFTLYLSVSFQFLFRDHEHFIKIVTYCCLLQAVMVYISFFYPPYRVWLDTVMVNGGNIPFSYGARVPGFSTGSGATLSVALSLGCFASMCCFYVEKTIKRYKYLLIAFFIFSSCILVGKTGLLLSAYFIFSILLISFNQLMMTFFLLILSSIGVIGVIGVIGGGFQFEAFSLILPGDQAPLITALYRSFNFLFGREDMTISALQGMPIPEFDIVSVVGTGSINDARGYSLTGNDIGYVQTYYGYGIVVALIFYLSIFCYSLKKLWEVRRTRYKLIAIILFIPIFIIELKEPFISKITYPFIFFIFLNLITREKNEIRSATPNSLYSAL